MTKSTRRGKPEKKPNRFGFVNHGGPKQTLTERLLEAFEKGKGR